VAECQLLLTSFFLSFRPCAVSPCRPLRCGSQGLGRIGDNLGAFPISDLDVFGDLRLLRLRDDRGNMCRRIIN
jgi:hypothetical protein